MSLKPASAAVEGMIARSDDPLLGQPFQARLSQMSLPEPVVTPANTPPLELPPQAQLRELDLAPPPQLTARKTRPDTETAPEASAKTMFKPERQQVARKAGPASKPGRRKARHAGAPSVAQRAAGRGAPPVQAIGGPTGQRPCPRRRNRICARGMVTAHLMVTLSGQLAGVSVARLSGNAACDQAALRAVRRVVQFTAAPAGLTNARYSFVLSIRFAR
ncbi:hypothetical protein BMG00_12920 [Thioclava marina]|uniref:TonB C-terminal domain-containing protein n=1 Tax=Thioclava marina TaxID=1915077 RepID=A0ABX3MKB4_9RHOB|nr:TonB family protein [Thioclava marina]OOY11969.1 hypothetical protein BMG00_12920 [Thioclava marina]